jgi:NitT/TauT family transport system substrate-binding protein
MTTGRRHRSRRRLAYVTGLLVTIVVCVGGTAASAPSQSLTTINVNTLPIANALPMDLGIQKGFFAAQGIEIKKTVLQSGNDIVLAMANNKGDVGYIGYVPAMIGRTQGIPITVIAASETEATSEADNWQNIMVKGSSSIRAPADLVGKTVALNALKGVGRSWSRRRFRRAGSTRTP